MMFLVLLIISIFLFSYLFLNLYFSGKDLNKFLNEHEKNIGISLEKLDDLHKNFFNQIEELYKEIDEKNKKIAELTEKLDNK